MGGLPLGLEILIPSSFIAHWDGREIEKTLELYCILFNNWQSYYWTWDLVYDFIVFFFFFFFSLL